MIDVENIVFTNVATVLRVAHTGIFVAGADIAKITSFPACTLREIDNYLRARDTTLGIKETAVMIPYQADVYSNLSSGGKAECKSIIATLDTEMNRMGFRRTFVGPVANIDTSITRMTVRYTKLQTNNTLT